MKRILLVGAMLLLSGASYAAENYDFPFTDPFKATVFGTPAAYKADLPKDDEINREVLSLDIFPEREVPEVFWYQEEFEYSVVYQEKPAPLVFSIAGTGGKYNGGKMKALEKAFFKAGYNVISITSPTHASFIVAASESQLPGDLANDAEEIYGVMQKTLAHAKDELGDKLQVTDFYLTGYSLGGAHSAFISKLDEEKKVFDFKKVFLVNPPVSLYNSVIILDGYVESVGTAAVKQTIDSIFRRLGENVSHADRVELTPDFIYRMFVAAGVDDAELAQLIGLAFRLSSTDMIFAIDVMQNWGAITYKNHEISKHESISHSFARGAQVGFLTYFEQAMVPIAEEKDPSMDRTQMINRLSLTSLAGYLMSADKISVVTNADDIILASPDLAFLTKTFGDRAKIYPYGGHCGNMDEKVWVEHMLAFFAAEK
ncbi:alpha/beta hydrolase [Corallincola spongiicola]|uniref:Alpha/beta hydrolase n=1 Tax=Corallincola spongiicola TaxID=2520508 RepID=A0ABY1WPN8_9GAMM|nr:alpha/beta hydrolase [Corallincola spongiicola]TAA45959.1 alpha/beta hydrolase [Corallincola spongiicola]